MSKANTKKSIFLIVGPTAPTECLNQRQPRLSFPEKVLYYLVLNIGYYSCLLPFKISWKTKEGFVIVKNAIQRCLCAMGGLSMGPLIWIIWTTKETFQQGRIENWPTIFWILITLLGSLTLANFFIIVWTKADTGIKKIFDSAQIYQLDERVDSKSFRRTGINDNKMEKISVTFNILCFILVIITQSIKVVKFLVSVYHEHAFSWTEILLIMTTMYMQLIVTLLSSFMTIVTLLVKQRVDIFVDNVLSDLIVTSELIPYYLEMKSYIDHLNQTFGTWVFIITMAGLPYYSFQINNLIKNDKSDSGVAGLLHFIFFSIDLIRAADANSRIHEIKDWLAVNGQARSIPQQDFSLLMAGLEGDTIGLKGGKYFTITYKFIGGIANALLTYAIIALQWNQP